MSQGHVEMFFTVAPSDVERCDVAIEISMLVFRRRLSTISLVLVEKNNWKTNTLNFVHGQERVFIDVTQGTQYAPAE